MARICFCCHFLVNKYIIKGAKYIFQYVVEFKYFHSKLERIEMSEGSEEDYYSKKITEKAPTMVFRVRDAAVGYQCSVKTNKKLSKYEHCFIYSISLFKCIQMPTFLS